MYQIMGSPSAFKLGRRVLLVSYISIGECQTFGDLLEQSKTLAVRELLYYSLHRANPAITRRAVRWLYLSHSRKTLSALINFICVISLPEVSQDSTPLIATAEDGRDTKLMYRRLAKMYGWTPAEISDMSPAQIHLCLSGGDDGSGIQKMSESEFKSFQKLRSTSLGGLN